MKLLPPVKVTGVLDEPPQDVPSDAAKDIDLELDEEDT